MSLGGAGTGMRNQRQPAPIKNAMSIAMKLRVRPPVDIGISRSDRINETLTLKAFQERGVAAFQPIHRARVSFRATL